VRELLENMEVDGRIILNRSLGNEDGGCGMDSWLRTGTADGPCEHDNKPSGSIRGRHFD
jgi:hypothetical protein